MDLVLSRIADRARSRGDGDLEPSELSELTCLEREDLVVATGDVGAELSPDEFPASRPCRRFLFPNEVAVAPEIDSPGFVFVSPFTPTTIPTPPPLSRTTLKTSAGAFFISSSSSSLLSSCLINFLIFDGECPSFPGKTIVSASESLFPPEYAIGTFCRSVTIVTSFNIVGGDDLIPFGVPATVLFDPSGSAADPSGDALSLAGTALTTSI